MIGMKRGRLTSILRYAGTCGAALLLFVGTTGCQTSGSSANTASPAAATTNAKHVTVQLQSSAFSPAQIHVTPGTTVTWKNDDAVIHTVTSGQNGKPDGVFDSKDLAPGKSFSYTFKKSGTYPYYCVYHPNMVGTVTVSSTNATTTSDGGDMSGMGAWIAVLHRPPAQVVLSHRSEPDRVVNPNSRTTCGSCPIRWKMATRSFT